MHPWAWGSDLLAPWLVRQRLIPRPKAITTLMKHVIRDSGAATASYGGTNASTSAIRPSVLPCSGCVALRRRVLMCVVI